MALAAVRPTARDATDRRRCGTRSAGCATPRVARAAGSAPTTCRVSRAGCRVEGRRSAVRLVACTPEQDAVALAAHLFDPAASGHADVLRDHLTRDASLARAEVGDLARRRSRRGRTRARARRPAPPVALVRAALAGATVAGRICAIPKQLRPRRPKVVSRRGVVSGRATTPGPGGRRAARQVELRRRIHRQPELGLELPRRRRRSSTRSTVSASTCSTGERPSRPWSPISKGGAATAHDSAPRRHGCAADARGHRPRLRERGRRRHARVRPRRAHRDARRRGAVACERNATNCRAPCASCSSPAKKASRRAVHDRRRRARATRTSTPRSRCTSRRTCPSGTIWTRGGPLMASADVLDIPVSGKGGHASTPYLAQRPDAGRGRDRASAPDARDAPHRHVRPGRDHDHEDPCGHDQQRHPRDGAHAGHAARGVASAAGAARSTAIEQIVDGHRGRARDARRRSPSSQGYPVTVNDDESSRTSCSSVAGDLLGADEAGRMPAPVMGAEDFSYVLAAAPGRARVPRRVPARRPSRRRARLPLEPDDDRRGSDAHRASPMYCARWRSNASS